LPGGNVKETSANAKACQPQSLTEQKWSRTSGEHIIKNQKGKRKNSRLSARPQTKSPERAFDNSPAIHGWDQEKQK
jgi:hypothetical protein